MAVPSSEIHKKPPKYSKYRVVVVVVVFIILLGESHQTGLLLGTLGGFLYYGQRERAMLLDDSRMEAHSTDLLPEKK